MHGTKSIWNLVSAAVAACAVMCLGTAAATAAAPEAAKKVAALKPTVAVLYFDYDGEDAELALLKKGLAQMFISDLSALDAVTLVERTRLEEVLAELELSQSKKIDPATAAKVGKLLGAKYLVMGGYFHLLGTLRIDARVVEVETGKVVKAIGASGKSDDFMQPVGAVADGLEEILQSAVITGFAAVKRPRPTRAKPRPKRMAAKTAVKYSRALDAKDRGDRAAAKAELEEVVAERPDFSLAQADLTSLMQ